MKLLTEIDQEYNSKLQIVVGGDFNTNIKRFLDEPDYKEYYKNEWPNDK